MSTKWKKTLVAALVLAVLGLCAAHAESEPPIRDRTRINDGPELEIFVSTTSWDVVLFEDDSTGNVGLRGALPVTDRLAVEASVAKLGNFSDTWVSDLSAKVYMKASGRTGIYAAAGPGLILFPGGSETTVHVGLGLEIQAGRNLYVRPEVRARAFTQDLQAVNYEGSLGIGWRF